MTTTQYILIGIAIWMLLALPIWAIVHGAGENDPEEFEPRGYVDQDTQTAYDAEAWKHAVPKTHHAE